MNYGYADLYSLRDPLVLSDEEKLNRYAIQMYHHVAGAIDLTGKVVEIGSGRGGTAAYRATNSPKSMLGSTSAATP